MCFGVLNSRNQALTHVGHMRTRRSGKSHFGLIDPRTCQEGKKISQVQYTLLLRRVNDIVFNSEANEKLPRGRLCKTEFSFPATHCVCVCVCVFVFVWECVKLQTPSERHDIDHTRHLRMTDDLRHIFEIAVVGAMNATGKSLALLCRYFFASFAPGENSETANVWMEARRSKQSRSFFNEATPVVISEPVDPACPSDMPGD